MFYEPKCLFTLNCTVSISLSGLPSNQMSFLPLPYFGLVVPCGLPPWSVGFSVSPSPTSLCLWVGLSVCLIQWKGHGCLASEASEKLSDRLFHSCAMVSPPKELSVHSLVSYSEKVLTELTKHRPNAEENSSEHLGQVPWLSVRKLLQSKPEGLSPVPQSLREQINFPKPPSVSCSIKKLLL